MASPTIEVYGTPEAKAAFRAEMAASAGAWRERAEAAGLAGNVARARECLLVAEIAARVAHGGAS